jgi:hypothetical protein
MTPFTLGRMRHLDLLALWHQLNPPTEAGADMAGYRAGRLSKDNLAALILDGAR